VKMWETSVCNSAVGGWFWIIPLVFMALCFVMMFAGRKKGGMMGCIGMSHQYHAQTGERSDESATDIEPAHKLKITELGPKESRIGNGNVVI
ncbi:MAG: hypothetical protein GY774_13810, partial [Planctomycetes bacterium]|nr:hypothetical protein [Planctomycetota bacterium]